MAREIQNKARKLEETNYYISISYDDILRSLKTNSLDERRNYRLYKALNNLGPSHKIIRDFLRLETVEYNLWGKGIQLTLLCFNLEWVHHFFTLLPRCGTSCPQKYENMYDL